MWQEEYEEYSLLSVAMQHFVRFLDHELFLFHRKKGFGYSSFATIVRPGKHKTFTFLQMSVPKRYSEEEAKKLYELIKHELLEQISEDDLKQIIEKEQRKQKAVLIPASSRLDFAIDGIIDYEKVIDADKVKKLNSEISVEVLKECQRKLLEQKPTIFLFQ
jgi:hypothetical protein